MPRQTKFPVLRKRFPRVVDYRSGKLGCILVDGRRNGNGKREYFTDPTKAKVRAEQVAIERENHGIAALNFPERDREMAIECRELLAPYGQTIRAATLHFIQHLDAKRANSTAPSLRICADAYVAERGAAVSRGDLSKRSLEGARHCVNQLVATFGDSPITTLNAERVRAYLDSLPISAKSRHDVRLRISGFATFCKRKGWLPSNPCAEIKIKVPRSEVVVLSVDACERLLRAAENSKHAANLVPYLACCLFGSLRPFEAQQLDWSNVDFETGHVHVLASTSKRREGRWVTMEPALVDWLRPYAKPSGALTSNNHRRQWRELMKACGYGPAKPWPQDGMRHTGCSMLLAIKRNRALVAEECGHGVATLRKHYRFPIRQRDAEAFWNIKPRSRG